MSLQVVSDVSFQRPPGLDPQTSLPTFLHLTASPDLIPLHQPTALRTVMQQMECHKLQVGHLQLSCWSVKPGLVAALCEADGKSPHMTVSMGRALCSHDVCVHGRAMPWLTSLELVGVCDAWGMTEGAGDPPGGMDTNPNRVVLTMSHHHTTTTQNNDSSSLAAQQLRGLSGLCRAAGGVAVGTASAVVRRLTRGACGTDPTTGRRVWRQQPQAQLPPPPQQPAAGGSKGLATRLPDAAVCVIGLHPATDGVKDSHDTMTWAMSLGWLYQLAARVGGAEKITLRRCALKYDLDTSVKVCMCGTWCCMARVATRSRHMDFSTMPSTHTDSLTCSNNDNRLAYNLSESVQHPLGLLSMCVQVPLHKLKLEHSQPGLTTYTLKPPAPNITPFTQSLMLAASRDVYSTLPPPDILRFDGWTVNTAFVSAIPPLKPSITVVFGSNMVWPDEASHQAAPLCQALGRALAGVPWVVHATCGVSNLAHMVVGRDTAAKTTHVITQSPWFVPSVKSKMLQLGGATRMMRADVRSSSGMPAVLPAPLPASELLPLREGYGRVEREARAVAAALEAEADVAYAAAHIHEATRRREMAQNAADMALRAAQAAQALGDAITVSSAQQHKQQLQEASESLACLWTSAMEL